jgi:coenzyme F420-reducing hydrogenase delta subunit/Pyruvate/2-oxoacid:ferredoxin oxidoreductase delta subunit
MKTNLSAYDIILAHGPELTAGGLDFYQLGLWAASLSHSRVLSLNPQLPPEELAARLKAFLHQGAVHPILLAALDPQQRARSIIRLLLDDFGLNPELLSVLDLQEAMGYSDPRACALKAHNLMRLAASMLSRARPISSQEIKVSNRVLVWGDSYAALKAAADLAHLGYQVIQAIPEAEAQPVIPCGKSTQVPTQDLENLVQEVNSQAAVLSLPEARITTVEGSAGDFLVHLMTPDGPRQEKVGALILAPEMLLTPLPQVGGGVCHPRELSHTRLETLLATPGEMEKLLDPAAPRLKVALVGGDSNPLALRRALGSVSHLLAWENCQVFLFVRHARVGAPDMEEILNEAMSAGLVVFKLRELPALSLEGEAPRLTFFDPVMHEEETLAPDLVIWDEAQQPDPGNQSLSEVLGLFPGPAGFFQADNVRNLPVITNRRGIYVAGPARGAVDLDQAFFEADAAVSEVHQLLGGGRARAPQGRAAVDRGRCVLCLTCHRVCPHGAITWDSRAQINELACQGCGVCASQCPNEAIQIHNFTDDQVIGALDTLDPRLTPKIVAFMCKNSAWEAYHTALKMDQAVLPLGFTPLRLPCAGKTDIDYLIRAFAMGADGVLVLACHPDNCRSQQGNVHAQWRVERARVLLAEAGVDPRRLVFKTLASNAPRDFLAAVGQLMENLEGLKAA